MATINFPDGKTLDVEDEIANDNEILRLVIARAIGSADAPAFVRSRIAGIVTVQVTQAAPQSIAVSPSEMVEIEQICLYDILEPGEIVELYMHSVDLYLITHVEHLLGQPRARATGWQVEMVDTPKVFRPRDLLPGLTRGGEVDWPGAFVNAGTRERAEWYRVTGLEVVFQPMGAHIDDDLAGAPVETALAQAELDRAMNYCCPQKISEGKPIPLCKINGNLYVITASQSSRQAGAISVNAWPAVPLTVFGEEKARTYQEASSKLYDQEGEQVAEFSYEGVKVNCGTMRKPDWWVMVGPEIVFTADCAAAYPDDEIEASVANDDEFTAARFPKAIYLAFLRAEGCKAPMKRYREISVSGERDAEIRVWIVAQNRAMAARGGAR